MKRIRACSVTTPSYVKKRKPVTACPPREEPTDSSEEEEQEIRSVSVQMRDTTDSEDEEDEDIPEIIPSGALVVRGISGKIMYSEDMTGNGLRVVDIVNGVCQYSQAREDEVHIMAGDTTLEHSMIIGHDDCVAHPGPGKTLELSLALVPGAPLTAQATSGREIEVLRGLPARGEDCHFDRDYVFISLGGFAHLQGMRYVMTSNDDRKTPAHQVMWQLDIREPAVVFLNFRSHGHIHNGGALEWLNRDGWELKPNFKSAVSSGYPNGPYAGPVYAKTILPHNRKYLVDLMGSNCWEGTYFVFVQLEPPSS